MRLGRWIVAVAAVVALSFSLSLHLTGTSAPWARLGDLVRTAPTPAEAAVRDDQRSHFLPRYLRAKDEDGAIDPNRWYHLGAPACQTMLEAIGFEVVDLDVGSVPRDPIVHFRRP